MYNLLFTRICAQNQRKKVFAILFHLSCNEFILQKAPFFGTFLYNIIIF